MTEKFTFLDASAKVKELSQGQQAKAALLGERWRRTHWALATATFAPAVGWLVHVAGYDTVGNIVAQGAWFLGLQLLAVVLFFAQCEMRNLGRASPVRRVSGCGGQSPPGR